MSILIEKTLFGTRDMVKTAIERIREFGAMYSKKPLHLAFSGGKDSIVCDRLCAMSGVPYNRHYAVTTVDPPELLRLIRDEYPGTIWHKPEHSMWTLIPQNGMPPLRQQRYCCRFLKESVLPGDGALCVTGIRWAESGRRSKRVMYEPRKKTSSYYLHPIIDWKDSHIWEFIRQENIPYCRLYDEGFKRLGCVLCPQQGQKEMRRDAELWPKIAAAYVRALDAAIVKRKETGKKCDWESGAEWFDWWVGVNQEDGDDCSLPLFDN